MASCYSGGALEDQRNPYAVFVNDVTKAIHQVDPDHPVTSTGAWTGAWAYYQADAPDLLLAVNSYGGVCGIAQAWRDGGYDKPYFATEGGAAGEWEVPNDVNGVPDEPTDLEKGQAYLDSWQCIVGHTGVGLGATFFHYGIESDFGGVRFNILPNGKKRLGYYSLASAWNAPAPTNTPPRITSMSIPSSTTLRAGQAFTVDAAVSDTDGDPVTYAVFVSGKYANGSGALTAASFTRNGGTFQVTAPTTPGVWKAYVFAEDGRGNVDIETRSFRVVN